MSKKTDSHFKHRTELIALNWKKTCEFDATQRPLTFLNFSELFFFQNVFEVHEGGTCVILVLLERESEGSLHVVRLARVDLEFVEAGNDKFDHFSRAFFEKRNALGFAILLKTSGD